LGSTLLVGCVRDRQPEVPLGNVLPRLHQGGRALRARFGKPEACKLLAGGGALGLHHPGQNGQTRNNGSDKKQRPWKGRSMTAQMRRPFYQELPIRGSAIFEAEYEVVLKASGTLSGCAVSITLAGGGASAQPPANGWQASGLQGGAMPLHLKGWQVKTKQSQIDPISRNSSCDAQPAILYSSVFCGKQIESE
jgi:hypothetical protein